MRYGIRTRISRFLALRRDALTFRLNAHKLVDAVGLEPTMPEAEDLQSPGVTNFPTSPNVI